MAFWKKKPEEPAEVKTPAKLAHLVVQTQSDTRHARSFVAKFENNPSSPIACVISLLLDQPEWDYAIDQESAFENALFAAARFGIKRPFNDDQKELFGFLESNFAGQQMAVYAWGLYADQISADEKKSA